MCEIPRIKTVSCLLRQPDKFNLSLKEADSRNDNPRAGDVVFVRALSSDGCINYVENSQGLMVRVFRGDTFIGVLADRKTGYQISAHMPAGPVAKGDVLSLIHRDAIAGIPICIPTYIGDQVMPLEVLGFARGRNAGIANLADAPLIDPAQWSGRPDPGRILFLIGTSSECGKTTFTANFNLAVKRQYPGVYTAAIKACGTGSNCDKRVMLDANYDRAVDFVDCGLATTYDIAPERYAGVFTAMLNYAQAHSDVVVIEIGGDFLEGNAPEALRILSKLGAACVLQVNDAMGAFEGLRRLERFGLRPLAIGCFRQNLASLGGRLAAEGYDDVAVMDNRDESAMDALVKRAVSSAFTASPPVFPVPLVA
jgi:hypothetical protein